MTLFDKESQSALTKIFHEVRNPVTLINSSLQIIEKEHPEVHGFSMWKETMADMCFLRQLLDELSTFNDTFPLEKRATPMTPWLHRVIGHAQETFCPKKILFHCEIADSLPMLLIDRTRMNQAFTSLLQNAFEAAEKEVTFCASLDKTSIEFVIKNDGAWIPPEKRSLIFQPFETSKPAGTGLGLAIAKDILDAHKAALAFTSEQGIGTTFLISFPVEDL